MTDFKIKCYRVVWATECFEVDQYGEIFYSKDWPTREEALTDLARVAHRHEFMKEIWVPNEAPHGYTEANVRYYERPI
jgi:hypothetical protein